MSRSGRAVERRGRGHESFFRDFEREAITRLCSGTLEAHELESVLNDATFVDLHHTGVGYFLTARHDTLPTDRTVCSEPLLVGRGLDVEVGFVVFLEDGALTLECHAWSGEAVAHNIRDLPLVVDEVRADG